jgi:hypothetical protein
MFAAPALNPAALTLTFLLFPREIAAARLVLSLVLVLGASLWLARISTEVVAVSAPPEDQPPAGWRSLLSALGRSLSRVAWRALPSLAIGALLSAAIMQSKPFGAGSVWAAGEVPAILLVAAIAVPLALPTFGEIPLALGLLQAGAPHGAVVALLVAGPAINLPSLIALRSVASFRVSAGAALAVFAVAAAGGILAGITSYL